MGRKNDKKKKDKSKQKHAHEKYLKGRLDVTRSGMGFVTIENMETDILIRPSDFNTALHGDTVLIAIKEQRNQGRRMQGVVKEIIARKRSEFIGRLELNKGFGFFIAEMDKPMPDVFVPQPKLNGANNGDRVIVRITDWEKGGKRPEGEVVSVLAEDKPNDAAMKEILL